MRGKIIRKVGDAAPPERRLNRFRLIKALISSWI